MLSNTFIIFLFSVITIGFVILFISLFYEKPKPKPKVYDEFDQELFKNSLDYNLYRIKPYATESFEIEYCSKNYLPHWRNVKEGYWSGLAPKGLYSDFEEAEEFVRQAKIQDFEGWQKQKKTVADVDAHTAKYPMKVYE